MKMEMTERDKKLLVMLSIFVIVVGIGYWGVYGVLKDILAANRQIEEQELLKGENDLKLVQIPMLEADDERLEEEIVDARKQYYEMMNSAELDRYITDLIIEYDLYAYDLKINISESETDLKPYQYATAKDDETESGVAAAAGQNILFEQEPQTGIHTASLSLRLGGEEEKLKEFLNELLDTDRKLCVKNYQWGSERSINVTRPESEDEVGEYEIVSIKTLSIGLEMYMCEE